MNQPRIVTTAFKEWASVIRGIEEGEQICLIRKGSKEESRFDLSTRRFWLIPNYRHEKEDYIQPVHRKYMEEVKKQKEEAGDDYIHLSCWVEARGLFTINKLQRLNWLTRHVVYSPRCLQERFEFQPGEQLYVLIVRAYKLSEPRLIEAKPEFRSCSAEDPEKTWVDIDQRIPLDSLNPALSKDAFDKKVETMREQLINKDEDKPKPLFI